MLFGELSGRLLSPACEVFSGIMTSKYQPLSNTRGWFVLSNKPGVYGWYPISNLIWLGVVYTHSAHCAHLRHQPPTLLVASWTRGLKKPIMRYTHKHTNKPLPAYLTSSTFQSAATEGGGVLNNFACHSHIWPFTSHPYKAGTEHAGFLPDQARNQSPSAKRRDVFVESHEGWAASC